MKQIQQPKDVIEHKFGIVVIEKANKSGNMRRYLLCDILPTAVFASRYLICDFVSLCSKNVLSDAACVVSSIINYQLSIIFLPFVVLFSIFGLTYLIRYRTK